MLPPPNASPPKLELPNAWHVGTEGELQACGCVRTASAHLAATTAKLGVAAKLAAAARAIVKAASVHRWRGGSVVGAKSQRACARKRVARGQQSCVIRGRLPGIRWPNADILHHSPPPAYAHGREAVGGAEAWTQAGRCMHAPRRRARGTHARRQACERRAAGWRARAEPTMDFPTGTTMSSVPYLKTACSSPRPGRRSALGASTH